MPVYLTVPAIPCGTGVGVAVGGTGVTVGGGSVAVGGVGGVGAGAGWQPPRAVMMTNIAKRILFTVILLFDVAQPIRAKQDLRFVAAT